MCQFPISTITLETKVMRVYKINILASVNRSMYNGFIPHRECNIARKILVMRAQLVRTGLLVLMVISIFLVSVIAPVPTIAQSCTGYTAVFSSPYWYLNFGATYTAGGQWYRLGDYNGYTFTIYPPMGVDVDMHMYNASFVYAGIPNVFNTSGEVYTLTVPTGAIALVSGNEFTGTLCPPLFTATPTHTATPTLTPTITNTPTDTATPTILIEATVTPSPVPTATPIDIALETQRIAIISYNALQWSIGIGALLVGLLMLSFIRVRL